MFLVSITYIICVLLLLHTTCALSYSGYPSSMLMVILHCVIFSWASTAARVAGKTGQYAVRVKEHVLTYFSNNVASYIIDRGGLVSLSWLYLTSKLNIGVNQLVVINGNICDRYNTCHDF